jgi:hypothetical protein
MGIGHYLAGVLFLGLMLGGSVFAAQWSGDVASGTSPARPESWLRRC